MDATQVPETTKNERKSELDKFKLFFEIATTTKEERTRIKRQSRS